ncbi:MAG: tRNA (guanosine(37)-N1)-methyltransferase TrmD [Anaerolineae bacterium]|nr:tRNA (guanosine(37)-N1)-methyltransferase TrmD [Anaerolineae bacterium]
MHFDILTLFPDIFEGVFNQSIVKRAGKAGLVSISVHNIRDYATDKHRMTDDAPYGGGGGMIMKPGPIFRAVETILAPPAPPKPALSKAEGLGGMGGGQTPEAPVILLSPQGRLFTQAVARELSRHSHLVLICGHYEGVDERVRQFLATDEISIGDYVLTGGEIPAMVIVDAVTRLAPGVLGDPGATFEDSHAEGLLEYPHYTRPYAFRGWSVPDVLLSGNHAEVIRWRRQEALRRTFERRPDLLAKARLSQADREFLRHLAEAATTICQ